MYKVKYIADGMIIWKGNAVIGIKGITLPEIFDDCDCYKLPGNAFDYALADQEFTEEQLNFINKSTLEWGDPEDDDEELEVVESSFSDEAELLDDDLPF
jgi:hypothetical protein